MAAELGIRDGEIQVFGNYKAKISLSLLQRLENGTGPEGPGRGRGKLVLVTAMTPTPEGEGKTTTAIGLSQAFNLLGRSSILCIREPSLGPIFGMKGVGTGGGYSQVVPMEDINLHFTGDIAAVTAANNLLSAMLDNSIHHDNPLKIDPNRILWKRCMDITDRELRQVVIGVGEEGTGITRSEQFIISAASEIMAILCLARDFGDLKERLGNILVAFTYEGKPVYSRDLRAHRAMAVLLHEAIKPNLVQTTGGTPAFVHGGPFANIAHGTSSLLSARMALALSEIVVTEAGFGSDLGAEKFFDIAARMGNLPVDAVVIVATLRALRYHGGAKRSAMMIPDLAAMERGIPNLLKHVENIRSFGMEPVVALNRRDGDTEEEMATLRQHLRTREVALSAIAPYTGGGEGTADLARLIMDMPGIRSPAMSPPRAPVLYPLDLPLEEKIRIVARKIYGLEHVVFSRKALRQKGLIEPLGADRLPVCIAKTQYSLSNDPRIRGIPEPDTPCTITDLTLSSGAGFVVVYTESINLMPGLARHPRAEKLDIDGDGWIRGLG